MTLLPLLHYNIKTAREYINLMKEYINFMKEYTNFMKEYKWKKTKKREKIQEILSVLLWLLETQDG